MIAYRFNVGRNKGRQRPREYKQELINSYDIQSDELHMGTTDLGRTFGIIDMYKDDANPSDVYRIEKAFSKLESDTARVFSILEAAEKRGRSSVELVRSDLNALRKFLFLIHYRNGRHARQFIEDHFDPMTRKMVEQYMVRFGLADSRAVWLHNLSLLLEDEHWEAAKDERLLWSTRLDYKSEAFDMQLGLYRAPPDTEFVLTENGLGLAEGTTTPESVIINMMSPGAPSSSYFPLTYTYPITPKLVVILRSTLMTYEAAMIRQGIPAEEARRQLYSGFGFTHTSFFHDIPRTSPKTIYIPPLSPNSCDWFKDRNEMTAEDRKKKEDFRERGLLDGKPLHSRLKDRFDFTIDNLTVDQAQRVNTLLLTHCRETISFCTPACLLQSIAAFEKDRHLTPIERKDRYASLKAKLATVQVPSPSTPVPRSAPPASPGMRPSPSQPASTSPDHPSASRPQNEALPLGTSMPGLRGALKQKARSVPNAGSPGNSFGAPLSPPVIVFSEQGHLGETTTGPPHSGVSPLSAAGAQAMPANVVALPMPSVTSTHGVPNALSSAHREPSSGTQSVQSARLKTALPGLRGAFNRRSAAAGTGQPGSK
ncbi:hypothetical protein EVJ58_g7766 [Rhodofomes roseus]|uniref:Uncharacterized protein n=1 Tax=Rhodofomes roseus TaxID=34475 RepID=A0A4Y9Y1T4_9APHY|nr:hypothetical protein EVJ58_g7766 [Rhodofomes roseus]